MNNHRNRHMLLLGLMFFGLASLQIYIATFFSAVPAFFLIALAGVFSMPLITEVEMGRGVLQFGLTALFGVLTSGLAVVAPYLFLFGWYPFLKFLLDDLQDRFTALLWKLVVCCVMLSLCALILPNPFFTALTAGLPPAAVAPILLAFFLVYDLLLTLSGYLYDAFLTPLLR